MDRSPRHFPNLWPGLVLIAVGAGLLARELGLLPPGVGFVDLWPVLVVAFGLAQLPHARGASSAFFSLLFVVVGGALLAGNLGYGDFVATRYWPALLIVLGLSFMFRRRQPCGSDWRERHRHRSEHSYNRGAVIANEDRLDRALRMSGTQIRVESQAWTGGDLSAVASGVELDLRYARLAEGGATLHLHVVMAGIEIRVPDTWQVTSDISPTAGGVDNSTRSTQGDPAAPRLRIVGSVLLGGVDIRN
jgi:hypothetical protein